MEARSNNAPLVVILGVTGSGKSALGLKLAEAFNGEIIAADSRTVYKEMDISTAKPSVAERLVAPHHLINVVNPDQPFTVADFKSLTIAAIKNISARKKLPILVGGTGLYIDAILYNLTFRPTVDALLREELSRKTVAELQQHILNKGLELPKDSLNPRRLIRTIESNGAASTRQNLRPNTLLIGLHPERGILRERLTKRVDDMVRLGLVEEIETLANRYGWDAPALQTPGFRAFRAYLQGDMSLSEAKSLFVRNDMNLAKRQYTWFKRNKDVHWVKDQDDTVALVTTFLNK